MLWNPLDPLGSISRALQAASASIVEGFQHFIATPLSLDNASFVAYLYGNAIGVYQYLALLVVFVSSVVALFVKRGRVTFVQAILVALLVAVIGPFWFYIFDQLQALGDQLSVILNFNPKPEGVNNGASVTVAFPSLEISDVFLGMLTFGPLLYLMYCLFSAMVSYAVVGVLVKFVGLITLGLLAFGKRTQKVFSFLISAGIVALVIGKPVAVLCISLGEGIASFLSFLNSAFVQGMILNGSILVAILIQPVLLFLMYKGTSSVVGKVAASVTGRVNALSENRAGQGARALSHANRASIQGRSSAVPYNAQQPSYVRRAAEIGATLAIAKGAAMLAAKAASNIHPVAKVTAVIGSVALRALPKRGATTPRR